MALNVDGEKRRTGHIGSSLTCPWTHEQGNERERNSPLHFPELLTCFLFQPAKAAEWFPGTWLGPGDPNVELCEKRLTFQSKCVTRKKGHFQEHLGPLSQVQVGPLDLRESLAARMSTGESSNHWRRQFYWWNWVYKLPSKHTKVKY